MKRILTTLSMLLFAVTFMVAQRVVKGTVSSTDGTLIGASVRVGGTTRGTVTDVNGNYSVEVPSGATKLIYSYTGYDTQEITLGASNVVDVTMSEGKLITEAVVTALGVKRNKSDIVYANQTVTSDDLNTSTNRSALNALQGKVAGVKISSSSGAVGASTRVVLRGETSLTQGNNALIVVDGVPINNSSASGGGGTGKGGDRDNYVDFGNRGNDVNPEDVESVTVLKGPAATTLYGSRGGSGVILITTKKGKASTKPNVSFTSSYSIETVYNVLEQQEKFGSGYKSCNGCGGGTEIFMGENFAWGAEFDGRLLPWTGAAADADGNLIPLTNGKIEQLVRPYSAVENNLDNFFDRGNTKRNSISIDGGTDRFTYKVSYTNFNNEGIVANTKMNKHNILANMGASFSDKLSSAFSLNYTKTKQRGATEGGYAFGYASGTPAMAFALQTPANIPFNELRDWNSPYHDFRGFYGQYSVNPYYILDNQKVENDVDNVLASVALTYTPIKYLSVTGRVASNFNTSGVTEQNPKFAYERTLSWEDGNLSDFNSPRNASSLGSYKESTERFNSLVLDGFANYSRPLTTDVKMNATVGVNSIDEKNRYVQGLTQGGLVIPGYYDLKNSTQAPLALKNGYDYRILGAYLNTSFGYKDFLFAEYSARNDWSSTLPKGKRGFFYQAGGLSFVPTNLAQYQNKTLNFLKLRASIGTAGKDAPRYRLNTYYQFNPTILDLGDDYQTRFPFNGQPGAQQSNVIGNPNLKPELSTTTEIGADLSFFGSRINLEYTYYIIDSKNQIVDVNIPWSSGFAFAPLNIGRIENKGHEITLRLTPFKTSKMGWEVFGSWATNKNIVKTIVENDVDDDELVIYSSLVHFTGHGTMNLVAAEGQPFGTFKGTTYVYDSNGKVVVDAVGNPQQSATSEYLGSYQPDFIASLGSDFSFRGVKLHFLLDGKKGGLFYSGTKVSSEFNGTAITTAENNRELFVVPNSVNADGSANTAETQAYSYLKAAPASSFLLDASFIKLRELSLSYDFPMKKIGGFKGISLGIYGRNLMYWLPKENTFADPEVSGVGGASDAVGVETTTTPTSRSYGVNLQLNF